MKFNSAGSPRSEAGQASRLLLVLAVVVLVAIVITYLLVKWAAQPPSPVTPTGPEVNLPVYEKQLGNINFTFASAIDRGNRLRTSEVVNSTYGSSATSDLTTGEKFIQVVVGAKNIGTSNIESGSWGIENIIDSQNREYVPLEGYTVSAWLPNPDLCGALLKPAFSPTPCTRIYEVSKESTGFRIRVKTGKDNTSQNFTSDKVDTALIDLIVK